MTAPSADDRREIEECLYRYAWMVDQRKWELMDSVLPPTEPSITRAPAGAAISTDPGMARPRPCRVADQPAHDQQHQHRVSVA